MATETENHALLNARSWAESLEAAHEIFDWLPMIEYSACGSRLRLPLPNELSRDGRKLLRDLGWDGDNYDHIGEELQLWCHEEVLSIEWRSDWQLHRNSVDSGEYRITITTGGPELVIQGKFGSAGNVSVPRLLYRGFSTSFQTCECDEHALNWFVDNIGAADDF